MITFCVRHVVWCFGAVHFHFHFHGRKNRGERRSVLTYGNCRKNFGSGWQWSLALSPGQMPKQNTSVCVRNNMPTQSTNQHSDLGSTTGETFDFKFSWKVVQPIGNDGPISGKKNHMSKLNQYLKVRTFLILNDLEKNSLFLIKMCVKECEGIYFGCQRCFQPIGNPKLGPTS